jgi:hypothetical protein
MFNMPLLHPRGRINPKLKDPPLNLRHVNPLSILPHPPTRAPHDSTKQPDKTYTTEANNQVSNDVKSTNNTTDEEGTAMGRRPRIWISIWIRDIDATPP